MLIDKYKQKFNETEIWKYYDNFYFPDNPFESESIAKEFISKYFKAGGKDSVIKDKIPRDKARDIHSVSTFFLGFLLKPLLNWTDPEPDFRYLWFMACLYHDYGYYVEYDRGKFPPLQFTLENIIKELNIEFNLLKSKSNRLHNTNIIENYYNYCRNLNPSFLNHGIIGGLLLYDGLQKNFNANFKQAEALNPNIKKKDFSYNGLHWSSDHYNYYEKVANSIVSHNIWYAYKPDDKEKYKANKLDELIIREPSKPIKCESDPFLFLLLLADTIEPIKFFTQHKFDCVLRNINIDVFLDPKIISITIDNLCMEYHFWFEKIMGMQKWLDLSVNATGCKLVIEIK